jgi:hypothetical protein
MTTVTSTPAFSRRFTTPDGSTLFVRDCGAHIRATFCWRGPLDDNNHATALEWLRSLCLQHLTKPVFLATPTGDFVLVHENGESRWQRLMTRRTIRK